jgi:tetratricopeptide (TPR) repeat protein
MQKFLTKLPRPRQLIATAAAAVVTALVVLCILPGFRAPENPLLTTPRLALEALNAKALYFNGPARTWLLAQRPELLVAEDRDARSERSRSFAQAVLSASLFRQLDRRYRFDTLLFVGDPSQYRTLLDHLIERKDFTLRYVDHTSVVFKRGEAKVWSLDQLAAVRSRLGSVTPHEQADFLALTAAKLVAAHCDPEAKTLLDEALSLDAKSAETWSALAGYWMNRGEFAEALAAADKALSLDGQHLGALAARTQVFYATKRFDQAYVLSKRLVALLPDDPNVLFKHAQIAHEAHAYKTEIAALEKLIGLAEADRRSTTGYRLYLAQAYTAAGKGQPAIDNFIRVLADPELPEDQRKFASESLERIKSRTGL